MPPTPTPTTTVGTGGGGEEGENFGLRMPRFLVLSQPAQEEQPPLPALGGSRPAAGSQAEAKPPAAPGTEGETEAVPYPPPSPGELGTTASRPAQGPMSRPMLTGLKGHIIRSIFTGALEAEPALGTVNVPGSSQTSGQVVKATPTAPVTPSATPSAEPTPPAPAAPSAQAATRSSFAAGPTEGAAEVPVPTPSPTGPTANAPLQPPVTPEPARTPEAPVPGSPSGGGGAPQSQPFFSEAEIDEMLGEGFRRGGLGWRGR